MKEKNSLSRSTASQQFYCCALNSRGGIPPGPQANVAFLQCPTVKHPCACQIHGLRCQRHTSMKLVLITFTTNNKQWWCLFFFPKLRKIMSEREILKHTAQSPDLPAVPWDCSAHSCLCFRSRSCTSPLPAAAHLATRSAEALLSHRHVPTASFRCWAGRWVSRHSSCGRTNRQVKGKTLRFL